MTALASPGVTWLSRLAASCWPVRKDAPFWGGDDPADLPVHDLARLAELSPHLLPDIGFAQEEPPLPEGREARAGAAPTLIPSAPMRAPFPWGRG